MSWSWVWWSLGCMVLPSVVALVVLVGRASRKAYEPADPVPPYLAHLPRGAYTPGHARVSTNPDRATPMGTITCRDICHLDPACDHFGACTVIEQNGRTFRFGPEATGRIYTSTLDEGGNEVKPAKSTVEALTIIRNAYVVRVAWRVTLCVTILAVCAALLIATHAVVWWVVILWVLLAVLTWSAADHAYTVNRLVRLALTRQQPAPEPHHRDPVVDEDPWSRIGG